MAAIVDDILLFPITSILFIFREIHKAALAELGQRAEETRAELSRLYLRLEANELSSGEFDEIEAMLLDRLDELEGAPPEEEDDASRDNPDGE